MLFTELLYMMENLEPAMIQFQRYPIVALMVLTATISASAEEVEVQVHDLDFSEEIPAFEEYERRGQDFVEGYNRYFEQLDQSSLDLAGCNRHHNSSYRLGTCRVRVIDQLITETAQFQENHVRPFLDTLYVLLKELQSLSTEDTNEARKSERELRRAERNLESLLEKRNELRAKHPRDMNPDALGVSEYHDIRDLQHDIEAAKRKIDHLQVQRSQQQDNSEGLAALTSDIDHWTRNMQRLERRNDGYIEELQASARTTHWAIQRQEIQDGVAVVVGTLQDLDRERSRHRVYPDVYHDASDRSGRYKSVGRSHEKEDAHAWLHDDQLEESSE